MYVKKTRFPLPSGMLPSAGSGGKTLQHSVYRQTDTLNSRISVELNYTLEPC